MFFKNIVFKIIRIMLRVSNSIDPDETCCSVEPDLDPNCSQCLSGLVGKELNVHVMQ